MNDLAHAAEKLNAAHKWLEDERENIKAMKTRHKEETYDAGRNLARALEALEASVSFYRQALTADLIEEEAKQ